MVMRFSLSQDALATYPVTKENFEKLTGSRFPWYQRPPGCDELRHFAVCPWCDNPVQLIGLYRAQKVSPYGKHVGKRIPGFPFDPTAHQFCPYVLQSTSRPRDARRPYSRLGEAIRRRAIENFDRVVFLLREDLAIPLSEPLAAKMLKAWLDVQGYLYTGAHLRNIPWMIAYFSESESLYGQKLDGIPALTEAILRKVPQAQIGDHGRLERRIGDKRLVEIEFVCRSHRFKTLDDGTVEETMTMRVKDYSTEKDPTRAPTLYRHTIVFDPDRFERLVNTRPERAHRNERLLALARDMAEEASQDT